ncbi:MAG: GNAT family N-acetyltransferase [Oscillospiraceae bacterium]|nr:GNAT family N-acetyltransferase [Oscillospiraceae bacterium]
MEQTLVIKKFDRLTPREVYEILRIRTAVFVVEQECPYQEVDGTDYDSLHVWLEEGDEIVAYLRIFEKDTVTNTVQIGRVLSKRRGEGLGAKVLENGIEAARLEMGADNIFIEAQTYALPFYAKFGFEACGDEFLEDGIPHTPMMLKF